MIFIIGEIFGIYVSLTNILIYDKFSIYGWIMALKFY